jgi:hypothetical protein
MTETSQPNNLQPAGWSEVAYRWIGWTPGVALLALARSATSFGTALAVGLFGASQVGHWAIERVEGVIGRKLIVARYIELVVIAAAILAMVL